MQSPVSFRPGLARERAKAARESLSSCQLCAHHCGVDRLHGQLGRCRAGLRPRVFSAQVEVGDELELIPVFAIAFSGCNLRCDFCVSGAESWDPGAGETWPAHLLAERAIRALGDGARCVMFLGGEPTVHLPGVLELVAEMPETARLVWKTNGHASPQACSFLDGLFDTWLVDYKFGQDSCAERLAGIRGYTDVLKANLLWARQQGSLIVRHLLMPGHVECCWRPVATWLAAELPDVKVSLRAGFWPAWRATGHPELRRTESDEERAQALLLARDLGLNLIP